MLIQIPGTLQGLETFPFYQVEWVLRKEDKPLVMFIEVRKRPPCGRKDRHLESPLIWGFFAKVHSLAMEKGANQMQSH